MPVSGGNRVTTLPPGLELSADRIEKLSLIGRNSGNGAVGSAYETVHSTGGIRATISTATTVTVVSSSTDDDNGGGSGCKRVKIRGLNENGELVDENINLDGTTAVTSVNQYLSVYHCIGNKGNANVGNVDVKNGSDVLLRMEAGTMQADVGHFRVPVNQRAYLTSFLASVKDAAYVSIWARRNDPVTTPWAKKFEIVVSDATAVYQLPNPIQLDPEMEFEFRAKREGSTDANVRVDWQIILEAD